MAMDEKHVSRHSHGLLVGAVSTLGGEVTLLIGWNTRRVTTLVPVQTTDVGSRTHCGSAYNQSQGTIYTGHHPYTQVDRGIEISRTI